MLPPYLCSELRCRLVKVTNAALPTEKCNQINRKFPPNPFSFRMTWENLQSDDQLTQIVDESHSEKLAGIAIFKHSTRCGVSMRVKSGLVRSWDIDPDILPIHNLDLLKHRSISNNIAEKFQVRHESPQLLIIKNGECVYNASHHNIDADEVKTHFLPLKNS